MSEKELLELVEEIRKQKCERQNIELKSAKQGCTHRLYDTLSSFSNQAGGGTIIFGIDESDGYNICGVYDVQDLMKQVTNKSLQMSPEVRPLFTVVNIDGKNVLSAEIPEIDIFNKPCFYKGTGKIKGSYIRVGDADIQMNEYEVYSYEVFKRKIEDELKIVDRANIESLSKDMLIIYLAKARSLKPNLQNIEDEQLLNLQGIIKDDKPTLCGMMLFGIYPQAFYPQLSVICMNIDGYEIGDLGKNDERFIDNKRIDGTIAQMLEGAISFVRNNTKSSTIIDDDGKRADRTEYPMKAVREIILNALIHRDYSLYTQNSPIRVMIFKDRLVVDNPGGLFGRMTIDELGKVAADTRNPFIAGALEILNETENRFSGIPVIYNEMRKYGLLDPVFESNRGTFSVTLYNKRLDIDISDIEKRTLEFCKTPKTRQEIADYLGIPTVTYVTKKYIKPLLDKGLLKMTLPSSPQSKHQKYYCQ